MRGLEYLTKKTRKKVKKLLKLCQKKGLCVFITETYRTTFEQDELYAKGRTKAGNIVTYCKGSDYSSLHQWGVAFDFARYDKKNPYDNTDCFFEKVGEVGKSIGLIWGGDWVTPKDRPHFQLSDYGDTATTLKKKYGTPDKFFKSYEGRGHKS